ncbi:hypothetical protein MYAM1_001230 [Malassezia yamatoensis]|uniref:Transmembrane protein n=1 Tax=Malassezia yamatoensis TaxID=253288 RepID=A0AAJ6CFP5_9BASI|nr:hypothetical protein MYAM1_001230 [Malassezia yamatoensis]
MSSAAMQLKPRNLAKRSLQHTDISARIDKTTHAHDGEGEAHGNPKVPSGAQLISLPVGTQGAKIAVYWTASPKNEKVTNAYVMMHGRLRDGNTYWTTMNKILSSAQKSKYKGAPNEAIVAAPQMYSEKLNKGQYDNNTLAWADVNAWEAGAVASHPKGTNLTSMDALDAILDHFTNRTAFPSMKNVTMIGHGGGAQLMNRYAVTGKNSSSSKVHVRYIVGDPSSSPYFTKHRTHLKNSNVTTSNCHGYNTWRYGFEKFPGTLSANVSAKDYFRQYIQRDVVNLIGLKDVKHNGDQKCMSLLQGGEKRRDRNLVWWRYINSLARTNESLSGFPGNFSGLPNWSDKHNGSFNVRLAVVQHASHDAEKVFSKSTGLSALFDRYSVTQGWRPKTT